MLDENEIQSKLSYAANLMSNRAPILLGFYVMLNKRMTSDKSITMRAGCDNGKPFIEYSDWFVNMMEPSLLGAVLYANCLRIALHHCDTRVKMPEAMFRLASDLVVYEYARHVVDTTVNDNSAIVGQLFPSIWAYSDKFAAAGFDPVKDLTLEKVFDLLMQSKEDSENETDEQNPDGNQEDNGSEGNGEQSDDGDEEGGEPNHDGESGGEEDEDDESQGGGGGSGESDDFDDEDADSESEGESGSGGDNAGDSGDGKSESYQAIQQMFDPDNSAQDMKDWGQDSDASDNIRDAASIQFANGQGGASGQLSLAIKEANRVHVDAARLFNMFMTSNFGASTRQTWSMPNLALRRFGSIAPGHVRKKDKPKLLFAVDVSGSMLSMNLVNRCFAAVNNFIGDAALDLCYWDDVCSEILHDPKDVFNTDVFGGGMTNPQCVLNRLEKEHRTYDGMVFLTDCEFNWERPHEVNRVCVVKAGSGAGIVPAWCRWTMEIDDLLRGAV